MNRLSRGYSLLAPFYDVLAKIVIGKSIQESQRNFIPYLATRKKLLLLGGGTGWILPAIEKVNRQLEIHYIDASPGMITRARRNTASPYIRWICGTEADIPDQDYDCVMTNFYLDHFESVELKKLAKDLASRIVPGTCWLVTDFTPNTTWQRCQIRMMYTFFWMITGLRTTRLPAWKNILHESGGRLMDEKKWRDGFVTACVYRF
jgi:tRNA (cmo5U34)-methyltransferase